MEHSSSKKQGSNILVEGRIHLAGKFAKSRRSSRPREWPPLNLIPCLLVKLCSWVGCEMVVSFAQYTYPIPHPSRFKALRISLLRELARIGKLFNIEFVGILHDLDHSNDARASEFFQSIVGNYKAFAELSFLFPRLLKQNIPGLLDCTP